LARSALVVVTSSVLVALARSALAVLALEPAALVELARSALAVLALGVAVLVEVARSASGAACCPCGRRRDRGGGAIVGAPRRDRGGGEFAGAFVGSTLGSGRLRSR
jgi:hypothetical protein